MPEIFAGFEVLLKDEPEYADTGRWEIIVKYNGSLDAVSEALEAEVELLGGSYAILTMNASRIREIYNYSEIEYVELPKNLTPSLEGSLSAACVTSVHSPGEYDLRGKGVLVGIIDSGIDYAHPDFIGPDGRSRILYMWDQSAEGTPPAGFTSGVEYTADQLTAAAQSDIPQAVIPSTDTVGHGTAVAGIAAGNGRGYNGYVGVAPEASIIAVRLGEKGRKSFARTTEIMRALKYISDKALELRMPVAINLSMGTNNGSHSGTSLFETYIDDVSRRW
ncbi:MAG: S8 family serine peptidase, partial [Oscillospiraceae bacterium]|nr:S8 family serine peptidase [Oscillospiraceae bacterium]